MNVWLTPNNVPEGTVYIMLAVPSGVDWEAIVRGALVPLTDADNFELFGILTPEQTAQYYSEFSYQWWKWERAMYVGQVIWIAGEISDTHLLPADGAEVEQSEYPDLYAIISDLWGTAGAGMFRLPNLCSRTVVGTGTGDGLSERLIGETGGVETVELAVDNIPVHSHSVHSHNEGLALAPGELPVTLPNVTSGTTGNTGQGLAHENMPPFAVLMPYIVAR